MSTAPPRDRTAGWEKSASGLSGKTGAMPLQNKIRLESAL